MIAAIIQARIGSTRLPGKVLQRAGGKTLLEHVIKRLQKAKTIETIIVATTLAQKDNPVVREATRLGVSVFRGDEYDVLDRYYKAALACKADTVVRITADCPLIDPALVDKVVRAYREGKGRYDYVSNVMPQTFPIGMAVEVFSFAALTEAWQEAKTPLEREHVTLYLRDRNNPFRRKNIEGERDYSHFRVTVDTKDDLRAVRAIVRILAAERKEGSFRDIIELLKKEPKLQALNVHVQTALQERRTR